MSSTTYTAMPEFYTKVFHDRYIVSLRQIDIKTTEELKSRGLHSTGDPSLDRVLYNTRVKVAITVSDMEEYYSKNTTVYIPDDKLEAIYDAGRNYIERLIEIIQTNSFTVSAPIRDLMRLDAFVGSVFANIKTVDPEKAKSKMLKAMGFTKSYQLYYGGSLFGMPQQPTSTDYQSLVPILRQYIHLDKED